jgi:hypothetical protein
MGMERLLASIWSESDVYEHDRIVDETGIFLSFRAKNENYSLSFVIISSPEKAIKTAEDDMHERYRERREIEM